MGYSDEEASLNKFHYLRSRSNPFEPWKLNCAGQSIVCLSRHVVQAFESVLRECEGLCTSETFSDLCHKSTPQAAKKKTCC